MNNKRVRTKAMAMAVAAAMAVELCPVTAFAVTGDRVAADGTYTSIAQVNRTAQDDEDENEWDKQKIKKLDQRPQPGMQFFPVFCCKIMYIHDCLPSLLLLQVPVLPPL